jgi:hypothetical protein
MSDLQSLLTQVIEKVNLIKVGEGDVVEGDPGATPKLRSEGSKNKSGVGNPLAGDTSVNQLKSIVVLLAEMVITMVNQGGTADSGAVKELKNQVDQRGLEVEELSLVVSQQKDEVDDIRQRGMKGNLLISSSNIGNKKSIIKSDDELKRDGSTLHGHILDLMKDKFQVVIPKGDVQACHRLKGDNRVILRIWNRAPGSAWSKICNAIFSGVGASTNLYANFQLTDRRNEISFHLRKLKKLGKISKMYTTENGQLAFKIHEKGEKIKVTYAASKSGAPPKTFSVQEINQIVG